MKKIIGVGASVLDTIIEMDSYPQEDIKIKANNVFVSGGGPVGNALVCISKLGYNASFLGTLSDDQSGHYLANEFNRYGVETKGVKFVKDANAFTSFIILSKVGSSRTCIFDKGNVPDDPNLVDYSIIKEADILHLDGNYLNIALGAIKEAKKHNVLVSLDAGSAYPHIETILPYIDIFIASEDFAMKFTGINDVEKAIVKLNDLYHPLVLAVTEGVKGGVYLENNEVKHYRSFKVDCVDSNGAGDTFHGAFLVAYLEGKSIKDSLEFASATSAIKCLKAGVRDALPNKETVLAFLKEREEA